jgi:hypothetical protein
MSITLVVNNVPFEFPQEGEQAPWGQSVTDFATEVTKVLNSLKGSSDILETSAIIANNVTTFVDIPDFVFNPSTVRSFKVECNVYRAAGATTLTEVLTLTGLNIGGGWLLQQDGIGNSGITLDITPAGQVQYKSSNMTDTPYTGLIKFRGIGILNS